MSMVPQWEYVLRLLLATVLGGIIGFQRELYGKPAGARTLALIGVGAGMFGVMSLTGFLGNNTAAIAAAVVTGVGFLGAGAILHRHGGVEGLTTAATIWVAAGVGLAASAGLYVLAPAVTVMSVIILFLPQRKPKQ
jgi:putative Mg2+ transporter-C (MgtC) family protein